MKIFITIFVIVFISFSSNVAVYQGEIDTVTSAELFSNGASVTESITGFAQKVVKHTFLNQNSNYEICLG